MPLSALQKLQLAKAVVAARACEHSTGCPAELSVAQWALESGWGSRQPGNNCFGIKTYPGCCGVQLIDTWEVIGGKQVCQQLPFATFASLDDCFAKHAELITKAPAYRQVFAEYGKSKDLKTLIQGVATKYATDPNYAIKLLNILAMPDVKTALGSEAA